MTTEQCQTLAKLGNVTEQEVLDFVTTKAQEPGFNRESAVQWLYKLFTGSNAVKAKMRNGSSFETACYALGID